MKLFTLPRSRYTHDTTIGELHTPENKMFCYTLEDTVRGWGIKVPKFTAIPATGDIFYHVAVTQSQRFGKELPIIYTEIDKDGNYLIKHGGIVFNAVRFHGLNDHTETEGCVGVAFAYDGFAKIFNPDKTNRADDALTVLIKHYLSQGEQVGLKIINLPNKLP